MAAARSRHVVAADSGGENAASPRVITPQSAGWRHLGFAVRALAAGDQHLESDREHESCVVVLSGSGEFVVGGQRWPFEGRGSVFEGLPHALYVPPGTEYILSASSAVEFGIGTAPAVGRFETRFIEPGDVTVELRGGHNVERQISHLIDPGQAEHLLCVEVYTPSGNWSSYPPHRHDEHVPGVEVELDEVYHYRIQPPGGWGMQRLYDDARDLDDVVLVKDGDTVLVRRGYHPVVMAPGYDGYYLNFLAGDHATWDARDEPDLAWVRGSWDGGEQRLRIPFGAGKR
ncbi:MAG TPA: 5-deoxy-glucuronate isomerase [Trueperaceae bacterium]|nr:5-deoxy-glucuronate isomerase [Trueperaceae bacterium]